MRHRRSGQMRARKCLQLSSDKTDELENELNLLLSLDHPHVVRIYDWHARGGNFNTVPAYNIHFKFFFQPA